jgi:hypothetical protein
MNPSSAAAEINLFLQNVGVTISKFDHIQLAADCILGVTIPKR